MYRKRFGLTCHPLPKDCIGKTFFDKHTSYERLTRRFRQLVEEPGLAVLTAEPGIGKTAAIRNLCAQMPQPDHLVLYFCDTSVAPLDIYRALARELGVRPSHRRSQLWCDIKQALVHLVDERHVAPIVVLDEAQHLSDAFLADLAGFLNFAFDSRDLLTLWLVGLTPLAQRLRMQQHAALATRVVSHIHLEPLTREAFSNLIEHGLRTAGAQSKLLSDPALEQLFRASRGVPRVAARLLRTALRLAHEREQSFVDEHILEAAVDDITFATNTTQATI